jgi:hypothetical protein
VRGDGNIPMRCERDSSNAILYQGDVLDDQHGRDDQLRRQRRGGALVRRERGED